MSEQYYRVIVAGSRGGLRAVASTSDGWKIVEDTIHEFKGLDSNDDRSFGDIGGLFVKQEGWVALAIKAEQ